jgi:hypothetical protein
MKIDTLFGPQTWYVILIVGGIIWLGWFLSSDINQKITKDTNTDGPKPTQNSANNTPPPEFGVVSQVIDSLTIVVNEEYIVRYLGVTTPTTLDKVECFAKEALQANESLIGKTVRLEEDPILSRATDKAWVRYVWVAEDEKSVETYNKALSGAPVAGLNMPPIDSEESVDDLNEKEATNNAKNAQNKAKQTPLEKDIPDEVIKMIEDGNKDTQKDIIDTESISPDEEQSDQEQVEEDKIKEYLVSERIIEMGLGFPLLSKEMTYHEKLSAAARFSSATKRGLWGECEIQENENGLLMTQEINECIIKGIKLLDGQQIFRTPQCKGYKDTVVLLYKDDEWLCDEEAAIEKGYTKAIDC